jgi:hypothetical protein
MVDRLAQVGLVVVALAGCSKQSAPTSVAEAAGDAEPTSTRAEDPLTELARLEQRMRVLGLEPAAPRRDLAGEKSDEETPPREPDAPDERERVGTNQGEIGQDGFEQGGGGQATSAAPTTPSPTAPSTMADDAGESRCTTLCELSEAICQLEVQICSMAKDHEGDPIYVDACERAVDDCELSGDACNACSE